MFYRALRENRRKLGISQVKLSMLSGISLPTIQNIEAGKANPSLETLNALCPLLHLNFTIQAQTADLDLLVVAGLPLHLDRPPGDRSPTPAKLLNELTTLCLAMETLSPPDERIREATQAFVTCIHSHFPSWYERYLAKVPAIHAFLSKRPNGRLIKLSRQAHDKLSRVL